MTEPLTYRTERCHMCMANTIHYRDWGWRCMRCEPLEDLVKARQISDKGFELYRDLLKLQRREKFCGGYELRPQMMEIRDQMAKLKLEEEALKRPIYDEIDKQQKRKDDEKERRAQQYWDNLSRGAKQEVLINRTGRGHSRPSFFAFCDTNNRAQHRDTFGCVDPARYRECRDAFTRIYYPGLKRPESK